MVPTMLFASTKWLALINRSKSQKNAVWTSVTCKGVYPCTDMGIFVKKRAKKISMGVRLQNSDRHLIQNAQEVHLMCDKYADNADSRFCRAERKSEHLEKWKKMTFVLPSRWRYTPPDFGDIVQ